MPIYAPGQPWNPTEFAAILAIGDSWFWYPNNNLLTAIANHPKLLDPFRNIQMLGYVGAKLDDLVFGKYADEFKREMSPLNSQYYSAVFVSGAGNDAVDYGLCLQADCRPFDTAEKCISPDGMDSFLKEMSRAITTLLHDVSWNIAQQKRQVDVFIHGYDYPVPDGRGFAGTTIIGPWLKPAMDKAGVQNNDGLRQDICRILIDQLNTMLTNFDKQTLPGCRMHYIDSRGTLRTGEQYQTDWANEMHPTPTGFNTIVDHKWIPVLAALGYATN